MFHLKSIRWLISRGSLKARSPILCRFVCYLLVVTGPPWSKVNVPCAYTSCLTLSPCASLPLLQISSPLEIYWTLVSPAKSTCNLFLEKPRFTTVTCLPSCLPWPCWTPLEFKVWSSTHSLAPQSSLDTHSDTLHEASHLFFAGRETSTIPLLTYSSLHHHSDINCPFLCFRALLQRSRSAPLSTFCIYIHTYLVHSV